jgi:hypothetical protein
MLYLRSINRFILVSLALLGLSVSSVNAATYNVSGGELIGAFDVSVGGNLYDVIFEDGTCVTLFSGCDRLSDFTFKTESDADAASQALIDDLFSDDGVYDTNPYPTRGLELVGVEG